MSNINSSILKNNFSAENLNKIFLNKVAESNTIGKDGVHPSTLKPIINDEINLIRNNVFRKKYNFTTYKQRLVLKGANQNPREISIATSRDRITLRALSSTLSEIFPDTKAPIAHKHISEIKRYLKSSFSAGKDLSFIKLDVKNFYPSIDHDTLIKIIKYRTKNSVLLNLILRAIQPPTGKHKNYSHNKIGVPQGLSISNILSSIYMMKIDKKYKNKYLYFRYVDDILIICDSIYSHNIFNFINNDLKKLSLKTHDLGSGGKTKIAKISDGVDYLGYNINCNCLSIRKSSYAAMVEKIISIFTTLKYSNTINKKAIRRINLKITGCFWNKDRFGFLFYFSMTENLKQLQSLDRIIKKNWDKYDLFKYTEPKSFIKTYHEIVYNLNDTTYIPRFDTFTLSQKIEVVADFWGVAVEEAAKWNEALIEERFIKIIKKEMVQLEHDVTPVS